MQLNDKTAAVDNDFVIHIAESKLLADTIVDSLKLIFEDLELTAVMHPLVYDKEKPQDNQLINRLFDDRIIAKVEFSDIFLDDVGQREYYLFLVSELYHSLTGSRLPVSGNEILNYWVRGKSLGEIHSVSMCLICGGGVFLSDDGDSKRLKEDVERKNLGRIEIYNRADLIDKHLKDGAQIIPRSVRRSLTHTKCS